MINNPAAVVKDFLETIGGVAASDTDDTSFTDAENRMAGMTFGFALDRPGTLVRVAQDLAFQCRCALNWDDGVAFLRWLRNGPGTSVVTVTDNKRLLDSFVKSRLSFEEEVVSEVVGSWRTNGEDHEIKVEDATAEAAHGRKALSLDLWAHHNKLNSKTICNFWLRRLKDIWPIYVWKNYLDLVEVQRDDTVTLQVTSPHTYAPNNAEATIIKIEHQPGSGDARDMDVLTFHAIGWWCETSCVAYCETGGCETAMEVAECSGACETSCQGRCQHGCVTADEAICIGPGDAWDCDFVETTDLFDCESSGTETGCASCQFSCTVTNCETCQTGCETCQTGCETCQTGCETCETGCETGSQVCCIEGCQIGCEISGGEGPPPC
jgi:hypothetical protein